jgi:glycosyltransferase involved in cell wall biosynthesis
MLRRDNTVRASRLHVGLIGLDRWRGGVIYTHNLIRALARLPESERPHITLFCRCSDTLFEEVHDLVDEVIVFRSWLDRLLGDTRFDVIGERINAAVSAALVGEAAPELARIARLHKVDAIFPVSVPYTRSLPNAIAWIPDLQHCVLPEYFSRLARATRDKNFSGLLKDPNRQVVFSSQCALQDAIHAYGPPKAKTPILHFATVPSPEWFQDPAPFVAKYNLPSSFFIVCNQFWVHKDHLTAFKAVAKLKTHGIRVHLVCTGPTRDNRNSEFFPKLQSQIRELGVEEQVHILGMIPRVDQVCLIRAAKAVLQPSLFEGWSTVIEDARALGKPVIASDFPVHVEQNVSGSSFFRMADPDDCARAIASFLEKEQTPVYSESAHDARILMFARTFLEIVESAVSRSPVPVIERRVPSQGALIS